MRKHPFSYPDVSMLTQERFHWGLTTLPHPPEERLVLAVLSWPCWVPICLQGLLSCSSSELCTSEQQPRLRVAPGDEEPQLGMGQVAWRLQ